MSYLEEPVQLYYSPLGSDPDVAELVAQFVESLPSRVAQLRGNFAERDWDALRYQAHQLKGASGSYGFPQLTPPLRQLEQLAAGTLDPREIDTREIESALDAIDALCGQLRPGAQPQC